MEKACNRGGTPPPQLHAFFYIKRIFSRARARVHYYISFIIANSDFIIANSDFIIANSDFIIANSDFIIANFDFIIANFIFVIANQHLP